MIKKNKICVRFYIEHGELLFLWVSNKSNGQLCIVCNAIRWNYLRCLPYTSGCIFDEIEFAFLLCIEKKSESEIKKAVRNVCGIFFVYFDYIFAPIKITLNSIWMVWSTVLSWVPNKQRKKCCIFFSLLLTASSCTIPISINAWIRLRTASSFLRSRYIFLNEREPFFSVIIAHFYSSISMTREEKKIERGRDTCDYCWDLRFSYFEEKKV